MKNLPKSSFLMENKRVMVWKTHCLLLRNLPVAGSINFIYEGELYLRIRVWLRLTIIVVHFKYIRLMGALIFWEKFVHERCQQNYSQLFTVQSITHDINAVKAKNKLNSQSDLEWVNTKRLAYYSLSEYKSSFCKRSPNTSEAMKLLPSGSKWLNTRRAISAGVSEFANRFSKENRTETENILNCYREY